MIAGRAEGEAELKDIVAEAAKMISNAEDSDEAIPDDARAAALRAACRLPNYRGEPRCKCSTLVPDGRKAGVETVPLPAFATVGEVLTAFVDQSARLQMANNRMRDAITIVSNCEALVNDARPRNKVLGIF